MSFTVISFPSTRQSPSRDPSLTTWLCYTRLSMKILSTMLKTTRPNLTVMGSLKFEFAKVLKGKFLSVGVTLIFNLICQVRLRIFGSRCEILSDGKKLRGPKATEAMSRKSTRFQRCRPAAMSWPMMSLLLINRSYSQSPDRKPCRECWSM